MRNIKEENRVINETIEVINEELKNGNESLRTIVNEFKETYSIFILPKSIKEKLVNYVTKKDGYFYIHTRKEMNAMIDKFNKQFAEKVK